LPNLLVFAGEGKLILGGINFSMENRDRNNVIMIKSGELDIDQCLIKGANDPSTSKRDFGAGLILLGNSVAKVTNSVFKGNFLGVSAQDESSMTLSSNTFTENGYGIVLRDKSGGHLSGNEYYSNAAYGLMAYEESGLTILNDTCHNNKAGFGFVNSAKATVDGAKSFENEYHGFFIDHDAECLLRNSQSYSNQMSGIAIYGDSKTCVEANEVYNNNEGGFEIAENANPSLKNNKIYNNATGIYMANTADVTVDANEIFENETGISINDEATAKIANNRIYKNYGEAIDDSSESESTIGANEMYENGEGNQDEVENNDVGLGDLFAALLGSENLSSDPNSGVIPISSELLNSLMTGDNEVDSDDEGGDSDDSAE
jgi:parallel beta-helix repeat protein